MKSTLRLATALTVLLAAAPAAAQQGPAESAPPATVPAATVPAATDPAAAPAKTEEQEAEASWKKGRTMRIQYLRPLDKRGLNVFETTKEPGAEFKGFAMDFGAAFTSQLQDLKHENRALPNIVNGVDANKLQTIGFGFNNSTANAVLHAQLAPGIRVQLTSYLSARHHNETWVKDGYIQIDKSPIDLAPLKMLFEIATVRIGHMEINYGDAHFRRSDNGNAMYNPFVGNYILDAFTTEIGGEVYLKVNGLIAMGAVTAGELRGTVLTPDQRGPSLIGKLGVDRQLNDKLRVRLTGSLYQANKAMSNTLYSGDRAGSRYYWVMENTAATETANYTSGALNPGFKNKVRAFQLNPFVKFGGFELFGVVERANGKTAAEAADRVWKQYAADAVYRFLPDEAAYVAVRYNKATGALAGIAGDVGANRWQAGGGWFVTANVLAKAEYVTQKYTGFPLTNIRNGGRFNGFMLEGVVAF
ncbi:MAG TPA: hypothetical protein VFK57_21280 [Vicinamibacterales bacterium]|nr:hypothetical protein [Vicinamibacterales bacterium]